MIRNREQLKRHFEQKADTAPHTDSEICRLITESGLYGWRPTEVTVTSNLKKRTRKPKFRARITYEGDWDPDYGSGLFFTTIIEEIDGILDYAGNGLWSPKIVDRKFTCET